MKDGFGSLSTRNVAEQAGVPLSQIHYHFGNKEQLIVSLLQTENQRVLGRQSAMYARELPLWKRWELACDYFDDDIASGYVRVLQEMTAAGWTSETLKAEMQQIYGAWADLLIEVARDAQRSGIDLGPFTPEEVSALVASVFVGAESLILVGMEEKDVPYRSALRKVGDLIKVAEEGER